MWLSSRGPPAALAAGHPREINLFCRIFVSGVDITDLLDTLRSMPRHGTARRGAKAGRMTAAKRICDRSWKRIGYQAKAPRMRTEP